MHKRHELFIGHVQQLVQVDATESKLAESPLLLQRCNRLCVLQEVMRANTTTSRFISAPYKERIAIDTRSTHRHDGSLQHGKEEEHVTTVV